MAHDGAWPAIRDHGLKSVAALLDDYKVNCEQRLAFGSRRRPESVPLKIEGKPIAILRDQKPMTDSQLAACLCDGLVPSDWYELLNSRTFFGFPAHVSGGYWGRELTGTFDRRCSH
jgi:hypothetical protein